jgi:hypothetical protein
MRRDPMWWELPQASDKVVTCSRRHWVKSFRHCWRRAVAWELSAGSEAFLRSGLAQVSAAAWFRAAVEAAHVVRTFP